MTILGEFNGGVNMNRQQGVNINRREGVNLIGVSIIPSDLMTEIDISTLSKGLYFIRIQTSGKSATGRFIRM